MAFEFFALAGAEDTLEKPSGLIRISGGKSERFDRFAVNPDWVSDSDAYRHTIADTQYSFPIKEERAKRIIRRWLSEPEP